MPMKTQIMWMNTQTVQCMHIFSWLAKNVIRKRGLIPCAHACELAPVLDPACPYNSDDGQSPLNAAMPHSHHLAPCLSKPFRWDHQVSVLQPGGERCLHQCWKHPRKTCIFFWFWGIFSDFLYIFEVCGIIFRFFGIIIRFLGLINHFKPFTL